MDPNDQNTGGQGQGPTTDAGDGANGDQPQAPSQEPQVPPSQPPAGGEVGEEVPPASPIGEETPAGTVDEGGSAPDAPAS